VITRQFLGSGDHFLSTDDTDVVGGLQIFRSSVGVPEGRPRSEGKGTAENIRANTCTICIYLKYIYKYINQIIYIY